MLTGGVQRGSVHVDKSGDFRGMLRLRVHTQLDPPCDTCSPSSPRKASLCPLAASYVAQRMPLMAHARASNLSTASNREKTIVLAAPSSAARRAAALPPIGSARRLPSLTQLNLGHRWLGSSAAGNTAA